MISCKNHQNDDIDWFILYKMPQDRESKQKLIQEGYGYMYMDSNDNNDWQVGNISLNETEQALFYTTEQIYENSTELQKGYLLYNDELPKSDDKSSNHGHTKGIVNFDKEGGYWLVHSLPKFPDKTSYSYPSNGRMFGQLFLCISMNYSQLNEIGKQLFYTYPHIYDWYFPENWTSDNPDMDKVLKKKHIENPPWKHLVNLKSRAGEEFLSFAKFTDFDADIYDAWLAPYFQSSMSTETWEREGKLSSNCTAKYKVFNILDINIKGIDIKETKDHSKWGILKNDTWVCIGGINRMKSQKKRAGGMVCMNIKNVWEAFNKTISRIEGCELIKEDKISFANFGNYITQRFERTRKWIYSDKTVLLEESRKRKKN